MASAMRQWDSSTSSSILLAMEPRTIRLVGFYGSVLDSAMPERRWERWRPSVDLARHQDLLIRRYDLLFNPRFRERAEEAAADIRQVSPETEVVPCEIPVADAWDFEAVYAALHGFATAHPVDPEAEDLLVNITTGTHVEQICLFLLTESRHLPGRLLQASPPPRSAPGALGRYAIIDLDLSRYDRLASRFERERKTAESLLKSGIPTRNAAFNALVSRIERVAVSTRAPILLLGPTGAGKSLLARRIYEVRRGRGGVQGPLVELNCATLRGDAAMSALFGHRKGSFTGAVSDRPGLLRAAHGGVLFLDEIGELGADEQAMLLRALEEKRFLPLGSDAEVESDFQLLAGTNRDLRADAVSGRFRADLLARIDLWTFRLPALRDRPEDVEPNLDYELESASQSLGRRVTMNREARAEFLEFARSSRALWSGNFRDLNAAVTRMATLAKGGRITADDVREEEKRLLDAWSASGPPVPGEAALRGLLPAPALDSLDRFDRVQLSDVVAVCREARSLADAGRALFSASRARRSSVNDSDRLRKYLARFGLEFPSVRGPFVPPAPST